MPTTTTEAEIRKLVGEGLTFAKIAKRLDVDVNRLRQAACLLGISSPYRNPCGRAAKPAIFLDAVANGQTLGEIASAHGLSRQTVYMTLKKAGLPTSPASYLKAKAAGTLPAEATSNHGEG